VQLKQGDMESSRSNVENKLRLSRQLLAQYIGAGNDDIDVKSEIDTNTTPSFPQELYCDPATALNRTPEYKLLVSNVDASKLQKKFAVGKNMPTVAVGAAYMYDNLMDKSHPFGLVGVSVSVPISGLWGGSHAIKKSKISVKNAENTLEDSSELLKIRMQKAWDDLQNAHLQTQIAHKSIEQSMENLRLNEDYYRVGTSTMSDLLNAQTLFQQSRDKYVEAFAQFNLKRTEYLIAIGM